MTTTPEYTDSLTAEQTQRADALGRARRVLTSGATPLGGGTAPNADDLVHVAEYILTGRNPYADEEVETCLARKADAPEHEVRSRLADAGWMPRPESTTSDAEAAS